MSEVNSAPFLQTFRSVKLKNAEGKEYNITASVSELSIYEDIFSNTLSGEILFVDSFAATDIMKLTGNEKLTVELFVDPTEESVEIKEFYVYSSSNRIRANPTSEVFKLHFISFEGVLSEHTRVYTALTGSNDSSVKELFNYVASEKPFEVEGTNGKYKFVMPSWTPFEGINWYSGRSISSESGGSYFLFYETMKGFNFKSIESLITKAPTFEYRYEPSGKKVIEKDVTNIREYEIINMGDSINGVDDNYSTLWTNDLVRKKYVKKRFEIEDDNHGKLNDTLLGVADKNGFGISLKQRRDVFGSNVVIKPETRNVHTQTDGYNYNAIQPKMSAIRQFSNLKIRFLAFGNRKIKVGDVIDMKFIQTRLITTETKEDSEDKLLSGKFLVTAIRYIFKNQDFHIAVEAVKDTRKA
jgi:hypothetical protein